MLRMGEVIVATVLVFPLAVGAVAAIVDKGMDAEYVSLPEGLTAPRSESREPLDIRATENAGIDAVTGGDAVVDDLVDDLVAPAPPAAAARQDPAVGPVSPQASATTTPAASTEAPAPAPEPPAEPDSSPAPPSSPAPEPPSGPAPVPVAEPDIPVPSTGPSEEGSDNGKVKKEPKSDQPTTPRGKPAGEN